VYFRYRANAAMLLDLGHTIRGEHIQEEWGNPKLESVWCAYCRGVNKVILKWQRPLWESDQEVVKRSGRDEPVWVVIHMYMEVTLGISLCSCLYLKLAKILCLSCYLLRFLFNKIAEEGWTGCKGGREEGGEMAQTMYAHMNKWINNKKKYYYAQSEKKWNDFSRDRVLRFMVWVVSSSSWIPQTGCFGNPIMACTLYLTLSFEQPGHLSLPSMHVAPDSPSWCISEGFLDGLLWVYLFLISNTWNIW
jgi:hypothetical protein